jgi:hypothetical protein
MTCLSWESNPGPPALQVSTLWKESFERLYQVAIWDPTCVATAFPQVTIVGGSWLIFGFRVTYAWKWRVSAGNRTWDLLHCRWVLYEKSHSNGHIKLPFGISLVLLQSILYTVLQTSVLHTRSQISWYVCKQNEERQRERKKCTVRWVEIEE